MRILLDTVTFIRAVIAPELLSAKAKAAIAESGNVRELSVVSLTEIAIKQALGKLNLRKEDVMTGVADLKLRILPFTVEHAFRLFDLPSHSGHRDPFDRKLIAQALAEKATIVSCDEKFGLYRGLSVIR